MMKIFQKSQSVVNDIVDPEQPLSHLPHDMPVTERSFGDDISIPNLVREHVPRHIKILVARREQLQKEFNEIEKELSLLERLQKAVDGT